MTRKDRRAINRANASLSTGPITEAGKAVSSQNPTTHGLTALKPYLPAEEQDYKVFSAERLRRLSPQTHAETELAAKIVDLEFRIRRIPWLESKLFENLEADPNRTIKSLDTLSRHQLRLEKLLQNTLKEFWEYVQLRRNQKPVKGLAESGFVLQKAKSATASSGSAYEIPTGLNPDPQGGDTNIPSA